MRTITIFALLLTYTLFIGCTSTNEPKIDKTRPLNESEKKIVSLNANFAIKLFKEVNRLEGDQNIVLSPLSVSYALGMTVNGANGQTREDMLKTLELYGLTMDDINQSYYSLMDLLINLDPKVTYEIANSIWYRNTWQFEQSFIEVCKKYFDALVTGLDFNDVENSKRIINNWVKEKTKGKIEEIVEEIDQATIMFLINAIYFKALWTYQFDPKHTKDDYFYKLNGDRQSCKLMNLEARLKYYEDVDLQVVDLPYGDRKYSMTVILPKTSDSFKEIIKDISIEKVNYWIQSLRSDSIALWLPRLKNEYKISLKETLENLGMSIAFSGSADFSNMHKCNCLYIHDVLHKTFIEVDEKGTEAAAVTSVEMRETSYTPPKVKMMRIDRPFIFMMRENQSGTILFIGKIIEL